jgi:hypothetical protein
MQIIMEVYDAFKAGGTPDAGARAAAVIISDRVNGVKAHVETVAVSAKEAARDDIKELANVMREGFEASEKRTNQLRVDMKTSHDQLRADINKRLEPLERDVAALKVDSPVIKWMMSFVLAGLLSLVLKAFFAF